MNSIKPQNIETKVISELLLRLLYKCSFWMLILFTFGYLINLIDNPNINKFCSAMISISIILIVFWILKTVIKNNDSLIFSPFIYWFIATGIYFGVGSLAYIFGNRATIESMNNMYPVTDHGLLIAAILNSGSTAVVAISGFLGLKIWNMNIGNTIATNKLKPFPSDELKKLGLIFWIVGFLVRVFFSLPNEFHEYINLPSSITHLEELANGGLFLLAYCFWNGKKKDKVIFYVTLFLQIVTALARLNKTDFAITGLMVVMGLYWASKNIRIWLYAMIIGFIIFWFLNIFVLSGRNEIALKNGNFYKADLYERFQLLKTIMSSDSFNEVIVAGKQNWWSRICLINIQMFAMDKYDNGDPGDTINLTKTFNLFVPRILYPEKSVIGNTGIKVHYLLTGYNDTSTAVGVYGEGYWNGGVLGTILVCIAMGFILAFYHCVILNNLFLGHWEILPCVALILPVGMGIESEFLQMWIGQLLIVILYLFILRLIFGKKLNKLDFGKN